MLIDEQMKIMANVNQLFEQREASLVALGDVCSSAKQSGDSVSAAKDILLKFFFENRTSIEYRWVFIALCRCQDHSSVLSLFFVGEEVMCLFVVFVVLKHHWSMIPISFSISTKTTANETELRAMLIKTLFERILSNSSDLEQSTHETSGAVLMTDISHPLPSTVSSNDLSTVVRSESFLVANQSDRRTDRSRWTEWRISLGMFDRHRWNHWWRLLDSFLSPAHENPIWSTTRSGQVFRLYGYKRKSIDSILIYIEQFILRLNSALCDPLTRVQESIKCIRSQLLASTRQIVIVEKYFSSLFNEVDNDVLLSRWRIWERIPMARVDIFRMLKNDELASAINDTSQAVQ